MAEQEVPGTCPSTKTTTELSKMSQATVWNFGSNRTLAVFGENLMKTMVNFSKSWLNSMFTLLWLPLATSSLVAGITDCLRHRSLWWNTRPSLVPGILCGALHASSHWTLAYDLVKKRLSSPLGSVETEAQGIYISCYLVRGVGRVQTWIRLGS